MKSTFKIVVLARLAIQNEQLLTNIPIEKAAQELLCILLLIIAELVTNAVSDDERLMTAKQ